MKTILKGAVSIVCNCACIRSGNQLGEFLYLAKSVAILHDANIEIMFGCYLKQKWTRLRKWFVCNTIIIITIALLRSSAVTYIIKDFGQHVFVQDGDVLGFVWYEGW